MININELRRLAQAATPGPWWVNQDSLNHGFECGVLEINAKDWHALAGAWGVTGAKPSEEGAQTLHSSPLPTPQQSTNS